MLTTPSNVLPLHLKPTFPSTIWIFTEGEGDGNGFRLYSKIFFHFKIFEFWVQKYFFLWYTYLRKKPQCQRIIETKAKKTRPANTARSNIQSGIARPSRKSPPIETTLEVTEKTKKKIYLITFEEVNDWELFLKSLILKLQYFKQILRFNIEARSGFGVTKSNDYLPNMLKSTKLC